MRKKPAKGRGKKAAAKGSKKEIPEPKAKVQYTHVILIIVG